MRAVITLLQKEELRLRALSREAHKYGHAELYQDLDQTIENINKAICLINSYKNMIP